MSFNLDDPLAGILSDGSDDSFFDDDILGKKKPAKKSDTSSAVKKNALFDLEETEKPKSSGVSESKKEALFNLGGETKSPAPLKRTISKDSFKIPQVESKPKKPLETSKSPARTRVSASADKIDILGELGNESKTVSKGKSSQSILNDILGGGTKPAPKSPNASQVRPATAAKSQEFDFDSFLGKPPKTAPQKPSSKIETLKEAPKKDESKKKTGGDWLGIFEDDTAPAAESSEMPNWLVGGDAKKKKSEEKKAVREAAKELIKSGTSGDKVEEKQDLIIEKEVIPSIIPTTMPMPMPAISSVLQASSEDITTEGANLYLQQQESQLMVAMQLKAQEERLIAMQTRQKESQRVQREAALAHHSQLDAMLQRQMEQRLQMQSIITAHQQRISQRIKELLGTTTDPIDADVQVDEMNEPGSRLERENSPHFREKKQLLQLVQSLQENHDKEIDLMETSYRRQLAFLEVSLNQAEERMKEESDKLVKFYSEKIHWLEEHHQLYKTMAEDNMTSLAGRHKAENEMIRQQHLDNVRVLQEHHATLMENIKNTVKQEQVLIRDSAGFSSDLHQLVTDVRENKQNCQKLVDKVETLADNTHRENDRNLQVRETQINDMLQQLKRERDNFDSEKAENRDIIKMLESRLKQMTTMVEDETAVLKQKRMEFDFEKATFAKQTEFAKNVLKKQDEEIKTLREDIQREYSENKTKIDEERSKTVKDSAAVAKEKFSVQSIKQDLEKMKAELQAQLEEVTEERSKLSVEKQQMHLEEQRILAKSRDYDLLAKTTIDKQSQADKKYSEAEFLQRKYEERIRRIQEHVVSLNAREKQIAKEKVALSRERLNLHNERKQIESRQQCSLCKSTQNIPDYMHSYILPEPVYTVPVPRDYRNVDVAMQNIERDIASLMGRNYIRHSTDIGQSSDAKLPSNDVAQADSDTPFKDLMDPKFMMLRLDVQKVLSNLDNSKKEAVDNNIEVFNDDIESKELE